jgi:cytochrome c biogenesis factor
VLQDIGLAIHPPLLYLRYVGFSVAFAIAVAALIEGCLRHMGLSGGALVATIVVSLTAAWAVGEVTGIRHSLEHPQRLSPGFMPHLQ